MKHIVKVAQAHIDNGVKRIVCKCPIALVLSERTRGQVHVSFTCVTFIGSADVTVEDLPQVAAEFIKKFDHGDTVRPFEFEMEVPEYIEG